MPRAILFDLDDTLLDSTGGAASCWDASARVFAAEFAVDELAFIQALGVARHWFWDDPVRHRKERVNMVAAWQKIIERALVEFGVQQSEIAARMADDFATRRVAAEKLFEDALPALEALAANGVRLGLVTNGDHRLQRSKIARHGLARHFQSFTIEGELGFGKPDAEAYRHALSALGVHAHDTWMIGDNLVWDIQGAQDAGLRAAYIDRKGELSPSSSIRPDRSLSSLAESLRLHEG